MSEMPDYWIFTREQLEKFIRAWSELESVPNKHYAEELLRGIEKGKDLRVAHKAAFKKCPYEQYRGKMFHGTLILGEGFTMCYLPSNEYSVITPKNTEVSKLANNISKQSYN